MLNIFSFRTPIITTKPSEDHTYSAGGGNGAKTGNTVSTIVNITSNGVTEPIVHFNGNTTPPNLYPIQMKHESSPINNRHEITIDNRNSDNISNGTSSDAAYESSEER